MHRALFTLIALLASMLTACSDGIDSVSEQDPANPFSGFVSDTYSDSNNWLCHPSLPDATNVCAGNLDTSQVFADGSIVVEPHVRAVNPEVDCFYVYPTTSYDPQMNSDLEPGPEEAYATLAQAGRYSSFCRVFAPVYRQVTVAALISGLEQYAVNKPMAYADVLESFKHYMANENNGRGIILIGHSQGSDHLTSLIMETIETDDYLLQRLISAHLAGLPVHVPVGADIGGDFQQVPVCRTSDQTGCVINYSMYREDDPELADGLAFFGTPDNGAPAICTNPAALSGGAATFKNYFTVTDYPGLLGELITQRVQGPFADPANSPPITTPFYSMPDFISGQCVTDNNGINYLQATAHPDPTDPRADDFNGEFTGAKGWGLHLVDMTLTMGDLVELGAAQARSWLQDQ